MTLPALDHEALAGALRQRERRPMAIEGYARAAVLVPIVVEAGAPDRLLFIVRDGGLRAHAGQVAFPGGRSDTSDADASATAIREAEEELGIAPPSVRVLGWLDDEPTPSRYVITPVVARVEGPIVLRPARDEVADAFYADLAALRDPARYSTDGDRQFLGVTYTMHQYDWRGFHIWGATARIVRQLFLLLDGAAR